MATRVFLRAMRASATCTTHRSVPAPRHARLATLSAAHAGVLDVQQPHLDRVRVTWRDQFAASFSTKWLRDHCQCAQCLHGTTRQRLVDTASIVAQPMPRHIAISPDASHVIVAWNDVVPGSSCRSSTFNAQWLRQHAYDPPSSSGMPPHQSMPPSKLLWDHALRIPTHTYAAVLTDLTPLLRDLRDVGLVLIDAAPPTMQATEVFARSIGFVMQTIYGTMWTTRPMSAAQQYNDTAATSEALALHTDGAYMREPPGLQLFHCVEQARNGGENAFADGFHVARQLQRVDPLAYEVLASTPVRFHSFDRDAHLEAIAPMLQHAPTDHHALDQIRHNDYDRAPLTHLTQTQVDAFYRAHAQWLQVLRDPATSFRIKLRVGNMILVNNHRVLHARAAFHGGTRALLGCYIGRTEYESRLRLLGLL